MSSFDSPEQKLNHHIGWPTELLAPALCHLIDEPLGQWERQATRDHNTRELLKTINGLFEEALNIEKRMYK